MAVGKKKLTDTERARIEGAVAINEKKTGLQFLVYLGDAKGDPTHNARLLLVRHGYHEIPGVVLFVAPSQKRVELVTSEAARSRLSDEASARVIEIMLPALRGGDWVAGVELGLAALAEEAGAGKTPAESENLPDIME